MLDSKADLSTKVEALYVRSEALNEVVGESTKEALEDCFRFRDTIETFREEEYNIE